MPSSVIRTSALAFALMLGVAPIILSGCNDRVACLSSTMAQDGTNPRTCILYSEKRYAPRQGTCYDGDSSRDACPDGAKRICLMRPSSAPESWDGSGWTQKWYHYDDTPCNRGYLEVNE